MNGLARTLLLLSALASALAIALGAFGAHALKARLEPSMLEVYQTGVHYHLYHALGLAVVGLTASRISATGLLGWSGALMLAGIVLFSGSLYLLAISGIRWLGAITPLGGSAFIAAWLLFAIAVWRAA